MKQQLTNTNKSTAAALYKFFSPTKVVFSFGRKKFRDTVALLFICSNYCPTID